jgi:hypothetical protein
MTESHADNFHRCGVVYPVVVPACRVVGPSCCTGVGGSFEGGGLAICIANMHRPASQGNRLHLGCCTDAHVVGLGAGRVSRQCLLSVARQVALGGLWFLPVVDRQYFDRQSRWSGQ